MATNLRDKGYSSSTSGTTNTKKKDKMNSMASGIKDTLRNAYTSSRDSLGVNTYSDNSATDVYGDPVQSAGAYNDLGGVGYTQSNNLGKTYSGYVRTPEDMNRPEFDRTINTPLGSINYGQDYDTRYASVTPSFSGNYDNGYENGLFYRMNDANAVGTYNGAGNRGVFYANDSGEEPMGLRVGANRTNEGAYALGARASVPTALNGDTFVNLPLGLGNIDVGATGGEGYVQYTPNQNSILAQLLNRYVNYGL